jgi:hypothetical protein
MACLRLAVTGGKKMRRKDGTAVVPVKQAAAVRALAVRTRHGWNTALTL